MYTKFITRDEYGYHARLGLQCRRFASWDHANEWMVSQGMAIDSLTHSDSGKPTWWYRLAS